MLSRRDHSDGSAAIDTCAGIRTCVQIESHGRRRNEERLNCFCCERCFCSCCRCDAEACETYEQQQQRHRQLCRSTDEQLASLFRPRKPSARSCSACPATRRRVIGKRMDQRRCLRCSCLSEDTRSRQITVEQRDAPIRRCHCRCFTSECSHFSPQRCQWRPEQQRGRLTHVHGSARTDSSVQTGPRCELEFGAGRCGCPCCCCIRFASCNCCCWLCFLFCCSSLYLRSLRCCFCSCCCCCRRARHSGEGRQDAESSQFHHGRQALRARDASARWWSGERAEHTTEGRCSETSRRARVGAETRVGDAWGAHARIRAASGTDGGCGCDWHARSSSAGCCCDCNCGSERDAAAPLLLRVGSRPRSGHATSGVHAQTTQHACRGTATVTSARTAATAAAEWSSSAACIAGHSAAQPELRSDAGGGRGAAGVLCASSPVVRVVRVRTVRFLSLCLSSSHTHDDLTRFFNALWLVALSSPTRRKQPTRKRSVSVSEQ